MMMVLAMPCLLSAQLDIDESYPTKGIRSVDISTQYGDILIKEHVSDKITVQGQVIVNGEHVPERYTWTSKVTNGVLQITAEMDADEIPHKQIIVKSDGSKYYYAKGDNQDLEDSDRMYTGVDVDIQITISMPKGLDLISHTLYGDSEVRYYNPDMKITSTYGGITTKLERSIKAPTLHLESTYGYVDLAVAESTSAQITLDTGYGSIYSNHTIKSDSDDNINPFGEYISTALNGGNGSIDIHAEYGNIYLRKAE